ncbi:MAG: MurR/RpiR family transcriptional regulator [Clostridia bacterium]|nr:MurR/RpiR family transcriptional regulator [Clostridia bacterium]
MQDSQDLIRRLNRRGEPLSKSHRRIAEFIAHHYDKSVFMTASALGAQCGVSESTVVRFAAALGYEGYPQLQDTLRNLVRQRLTSEQRFAIAAEIKENDVLRTVLKNDAHNIRQTVEDLPQQNFDDAVSRILAARRVYVMGLRSAAPLAQFLYHYLHQILDLVFLVQNTIGDVVEEIARIGEGDLLIGLSFPRYSARTLECMRFAQARSAEVIGITDGKLSPLYEAAHICLCAHTDMASFVDSLAAPLSVINALIVSVGLKRREELSGHFNRLEEIWNDQHVYIGKEPT